MRHAAIPSREYWADGPQEVFTQDAARFRAETIERWLELREKARDRQPSNAQTLGSSLRPLPYDPRLIAAEMLQSLGYGTGLARFTVPRIGAEGHSKEGLAAYIRPEHMAIRKPIEPNPQDKARRPHHATLNRIHDGRIILDTFNIGSRPHSRAREAYAPLGDKAELAIQRTFMTAALAEDYSINLADSGAPLIPAADLFMQRARGLYGTLRHEGVHPYSYDDLGAIALCAIDLEGLNSLGLRPPVERSGLEASVYA